MLHIKELRADALFLIIDFLGELNIVDDVYELFFVDNAIDFEYKNPNKPTKAEIKKHNELIKARGIDLSKSLIKLIITNLGRSKNAIYELLGSATETDAETIKSLKMAELVRLIVELFKKKELLNSLKPLLELFARETNEGSETNTIV